MQFFARRLFVVWRTLARCFLGFWSWPLALLYLASTGSVLRKSILCLGFGFFLCPCLEPSILGSISGTHIYCGRQKIAQQLGAPLQIPSVIRLSYTGLVNTFPNRQFTHFTFSLNPSPNSKTLIMCQNRSRLLIFHSIIFLSHKKLIFQKLLMTSLHVICGLTPPQIKNSG